METCVWFSLYVEGFVYTIRYLLENRHKNFPHQIIVAANNHSYNIISCFEQKINLASSFLYDVQIDFSIAMKQIFRLSVDIYVYVRADVLFIKNSAHLTINVFNQSVIRL